MNQSTNSPDCAAATAASPDIFSSRRALAITGRPQHFLYGGGSFRPRPAIAYCAHAGRDTSRIARGLYPPPPHRCARKDPHTCPPTPYLRRSGNPRLVLPGGVISCECVRLTSVPSAVLPPRRSRLPEGRMLPGLPLLYRS